MTLEIRPPDPDRPPLRTNLFELTQKANANLTLLFPYMNRGAIVSAGAIFSGGPDANYGHFIHHNSVSEIITTFATNGGMLKQGQTYIGDYVHGVNSFLRDEKNPENFAIAAVVQRQAESGPQSEAMSILCSNCRRKLFQYDFDATPSDTTNERDHEFPTSIMCNAATTQFNSDESYRTCKECGHVNDPFPAESWGWNEYINRAGRAMKARARSA